MYVDRILLSISQIKLLNKWSLENQGLGEERKYTKQMRGRVGMRIRKVFMEEKEEWRITST